MQRRTCQNEQKRGPDLQHTCFSGKRKEALLYFVRHAHMSRLSASWSRRGTAARSCVVPHVLSVSRSGYTKRLDSDST